MNLSRTLRKEPIPSGVFVIRGEQGVGKTSFATALLSMDYKRHRKYRAEQARELARKFYEDSGVRLDVSKHNYYSSIKILLDKSKDVYTHYIDVQRLGLPNPDFAVQYLPRGSVVFIQEADILLFCRDYMSLNSYLINLLKFVRHNLITVIFDCQTDGALDKAVRRLVVGIYHIECTYKKRFFLFWNPRSWKFLYIRNQLNEVLKDLAQVGVKCNISVVSRGKLRFFENVFDRYNSFSGVPYYLNGIEKVGYEYLPHPKSDLSLKGIKEFCELHPLERPEVMIKRKR